MKFAEKYQEKFGLEKSKGKLHSLISSFMLTLPHCLTALILIILFPQRIFGILIVGLLLPDFSYFFHGFIYPRSFSSKNSLLDLRRESHKKIAHILTLIVIIFLFFHKEYILFIAGGVHLVLDLLGF